MINDPYKADDDDVIAQVRAAAFEEGGGYGPVAIWRCACGEPACETRVFITTSMTGRVHFAANVTLTDPPKLNVLEIEDDCDIDEMITSEAIDEWDRSLFAGWLKHGLRAELAAAIGNADLACPRTS